MVFSFRLHADGRGEQAPRLSLWEVCAEVGNNFPARKVNESLHGVYNIVVLSGDASYAGVDVFPPSRQGQLPRD